jgi:SPP1 gp7 family putative phage head morphogenesis protein
MPDKTPDQVLDEFFETHHYDVVPHDWRQVQETFDDPDDDDVEKSFTAGASATSGLTGYSLEGQKKKKKKRGPKYTKVEGERIIGHVRLARLIGKAKRKKARIVTSKVTATLKRKETAVAARLHSVLRTQGKRIANAVSARVVLPSATSKLARMLMIGFSKAKSPTDEEIDHILDGLDLEGFAASVSGEITDDLMEEFKEAGIDAIKAAGIEVDESIVQHMDEKALEFAQERGAEMVGMKWEDGQLVDNPNSEWSIDDTTREDLRAMISEGIAEGYSSEELKQEILDGTDFSEARAMLIARTELATAHVQGNMEGWRASGVVSMKRWLVADSDVCDECEPLDGEEVGLDDAFSSGDDGPPLHPACRCDVVGVVEGDEDQSQQDEETK